MKVEVRLYGALRRYRPADPSGEAPSFHLPFKVDLPSHATVDILADRLGIPEGFISAAAVNDQAVDSSAGLVDGDRISLFPPSAGG